MSPSATINVSSSCSSLAFARLHYAFSEIDKTKSILSLTIGLSLMIINTFVMDTSSNRLYDTLRSHLESSTVLSQTNLES
ncbi:hypothetical protein PSHT_11814 [Puccinia striiformis]|uniref:Uncharacterized protein n=1 Tax=Puccinia striiformis TaxID=27350 RepID=A0A2S4V0U8_9BASI|nr:hypothetical protein PSHT_11814 [Puccinia striiformis]